MCGIIGCFNYGKSRKEKVNEDLSEILQDQINRGKEGFGLIVIDEDKHVKVKRATVMPKLFVDLSLPENQARNLICHHRMPTSSENKISQTHPIYVHANPGLLEYDYLVVHNGVIRNDDELRKEHEAEGFVYGTVRMKTTWSKPVEEFNDSECFAIEIGKFIEGKTDGIKAFGSVAFIAVQVHKMSGRAVRVFFGRNEGNPLKLALEKGSIRMSSEGTGENIEAFKLHYFDIGLDKYKIHKKPLRFAEEPKASPVVTGFSYYPSVRTGESLTGVRYNVSRDEVEKEEKDDKEPVLIGEEADEDDDELDDYKYRSVYDEFDFTIGEEIAETISDNQQQIADALEDYYDILTQEDKLLVTDLKEERKKLMHYLGILLKDCQLVAQDIFDSRIYGKEEKEGEANKRDEKFHV